MNRRRVLFFDFSKQSSVCILELWCFESDGTRASFSNKEAGKLFGSFEKNELLNR